MKVTKIIARENANADSIKGDRRVIPEEELKVIAKAIRLAESKSKGRFSAISRMQAEAARSREDDFDLER